MRALENFKDEAFEFGAGTVYGWLFRSSLDRRFWRAFWCDDHGMLERRSAISYANAVVNDYGDLAPV